jgi:hypothetical protein
MLDLVVVHHAVLGHDIFQQQSKPRNVPLTIAQCVKEPVLGIDPGHFECQIKRAARSEDTQILVEDQKRLSDSIHDSLCQCPGLAIFSERLTVRRHVPFGFAAAFVATNVPVIDFRAAPLSAPQRCRRPPKPGWSGSRKFASCLAPDTLEGYAARGHQVCAILTTYSSRCFRIRRHFPRSAFVQYPFLDIGSRRGGAHWFFCSDGVTRSHATLRRSEPRSTCRTPIGLFVLANTSSVGRST